MSALVSVRGGIPLPMLSGTSDSVPGLIPFITGGVAGISNFIHFENLSTTVDVVISFNQADATAGRGITVPSTLGSAGNPLELPIEAAEFWVQSASAAAWKALILVRRG